MIEAMKQALHVMESVRVQVTSRERINKPYGEEWYDEAITSLRQAIAEAEKQEPVAYCEIHHLPEPCVQCEKEHEGYNTHPPQRKPLTDEQAMDAYFETPPFGTYKEAFIAGIRFIEAAHGIKGEA